MDLTGQLLVAMPAMGDPRFDRSSIFICAHSDDGAMGLIINKRADELTLEQVLEGMEIGPGDGCTGMPVHIGGPVETGRGFVLHSDDHRGALDPLVVPGGFALTATQDILDDIAAGAGPRRAIFALGYAGWGAGQLESEISQNVWLTCPASFDLVFSRPDDAKWDAALDSIGIDPLTLSAHAGRA
ncbi:YqgE/AlgH family protein [Sulfitobacter sp. S190]|uniref:YqgE/AlgH family protein n=1 Tax=Sulfitobacter sp. S190 TaxID=2867022 RepID=UPI0021A4F7EE|nr:YqgE/AlgH family protein [Sulfitobacter sp. S190]UWR23081.1 YqgE/AlgH family protein [Sulfitobacter sp. S190]